jgi:hypothetical protein
MCVSRGHIVARVEIDTGVRARDRGKVGQAPTRYDTRAHPVTDCGTGVAQRNLIYQCMS